MQIAFTADLHLKSAREAPERFKAFKNILETLKKEKISELVLAGDIFDSEGAPAADFERLCISEAKIKFHIIPGNHDPLIGMGKILADNVNVYSTPSVKEFEGMQLILIPYAAGKSMGESIEEARLHLDKEKPFCITGHGDWLGGRTEVNPLEEGTYMPLTKADVNRFNPIKVILGHIHKPMDSERVFYPGSPFPLHINETGPRSFLVLNTAGGDTSRFNVETDKLYFSADIFILPLEDEVKSIKAQARNIKEQWSLSELNKKKSRIRIKASGYTSDREKAVLSLKEEFKEYGFYDNGPDISRLMSVSDDPERMDLAHKSIEYIEKELKWDFSQPESPSKEDVIKEALRIIYKK